MYPRVNSKSLMFIAIMASLGNVLSFITMQLTPIAPNIPLGPVSVSIALDISHLTTFIAAMYGGPAIGAITGAVGGLVAAFQFGFSQGNIVTGIGLPVGKALTGLTAGYVFNWFKESRSPNVISAMVSYIPEAILTYVLFRYLLPVTTGIPVGIAVALSFQIITKAFIEMVILGVMLTGLTGNTSFRGLLEGYFRENQ
jgi:thiamine transporter ThiT